MPYKVIKRGPKWCVVKEANNDRAQETIGCHDSEPKATSQMKAILISESLRRKQQGR